MKRIRWIVLDFLLSVIVAILGNIVAAYLQERFNLTDSTRFLFVTVLFIVCLVLLFVVTLKLVGAGQDNQDGSTAQTDTWAVKVRQRVRKLYGKLTGARIRKMTTGEVGIDQNIGTVDKSGEVVGFDGQEVDSGTIESNQKIGKVENGGSVTSVSIDRMGEGSDYEFRDIRKDRNKKSRRRTGNRD